MSFVSDHENTTFEDIELLNLTEGYYSLSHKTKTILEAVAEKGRNNPNSFDYVIKADDDTFVNIPLICANLAVMETSNIYGGKCHMKTVPYRADSKTFNEKFILTQEEYSRTSFPPHCEGAFYYMSRDMLYKLTDIGFKKAQYLKFEDVYIGLSFEAAGVEFTDLERYNFLYHYLYSQQVCVCFLFIFYPTITPLTAPSSRLSCFG